MTTEEMAASLARIEAQGVATHDRLGELRDDLLRHAAEDDVRFDKLNSRVTRGAVKQGWMLGIGVGVIAFANWAKDHLTF